MLAILSHGYQCNINGTDSRKLMVLTFAYPSVLRPKRDLANSIGMDLKPHKIALYDFSPAKIFGGV